MTKVICEKAKLGRCNSKCPTESKPHDPTNYVLNGQTVDCTTPSRCWEFGYPVKCVPVGDLEPVDMEDGTP